MSKENKELTEEVKTETESETVPSLNIPEEVVEEDKENAVEEVKEDAISEESPVEITTEQALEEPVKEKKPFPLNLVVALCVIVCLGAMLIVGNFKKNTYDLSEIFGTTNTVKLTLPHDYCMDESGYIYSTNDNGFLEGIGSIAAMDCDEETYESYKEMYISYGGVEESLNNLEVVHISDGDETTSYDVYLFYQNETIYQLYFSNLSLSECLEIFDGLN